MVPRVFRNSAWQKGFTLYPMLYLKNNNAVIAFTTATARKEKGLNPSELGRDERVKIPYPLPFPSLFSHSSLYYTEIHTNTTVAFPQLGNYHMGKIVFFFFTSSPAAS